ncbi:MAG: hypothetical protein PF444_00510 [Bacteroidales bacterium]|jgi:hypothetical protein|nr:hypothetical protein [Bacteroidales bacterium]
MEYINKQTGHVINTGNRTIQLPEVMNGQLYVKNRMSENLTLEELEAKGYSLVEQKDNPDKLPLSDVLWDGDHAYRVPIASGFASSAEPEG